MDSSVLLSGWPGEDGVDTVIRSLLVVRNGTIVAEEYFNGRQVHEAADMYSASKSVISALVGIAIAEGFIEDIDRPVADFLPRLFATLDDPAKSEVTLRHLLTMTAGLEWENRPNVDYAAVYSELDWLDGFWSYPLLTEPGEEFNYNTGLTHTLSAVISQSTGLSTCDFATRYLVDPLGITAELWTEDPFGYFVGGSGIFMTPREMAKFGLLYLHDGRWDGEQIVPASWVEESTAQQVPADGSDSYGYLWWPETIRGQETFAAHGFGGQAILVIPDLDVVVVTTGADDPHIATGTRTFYLSDFVANHVIPSITG